MTEAHETTLDESGTLIGERYRLLRALGEGGAGIVYAATDERIGAEVAIKVVRGSARRDAVTVARFHREARAAGRLGHPNIVRVTDFGTSPNGSPYVVMERLEGETLEARIAREGRLAVETAIDVHLQLADALAAAHTAGVLHRDVKPANVFLTQLATGKVLVKLLDFGLAELYEEPGSPRLTERGLLVGSLAYLAPERVAGETADERSDVYPIGVSLYESLTGALPFEAPNSMMMRAKILGGVTPTLERADVPVALAELVQRCLSRDPKERPASAAEVRRRLLSLDEPERRPPPVVVEHRVPTTRDAKPEVVPARRPQPSRALLIGAAIAALALLLGLLWQRSPSAEPPSATPRTDGETAPASEARGAATESVTPAPTTAPSVIAPPPPVIALPVTAPPVTAPPVTAPPAAAPPVAAPPPRPRGTRREETPASVEAPTAEPPPAEASPREDEGAGASRFDRVLEPDWTERLPH